MLKTARRSFGWKLFAALFIFAALIGIIWYVIPLAGLQAWSERRAELDSLRLVESVIAQGSTPKDWKVRAFVPTSAIQSLGNQFIGAEYKIATGKPDAQGRVDGWFVVTLEKLDIRPTQGSLRAALSAVLTYQAQRSEPFWANARAHVDIDGLFLPNLSQTAGVLRLVSLRFVPTGIAPGFSFGMFRQDLKGIFESALAEKALETFAEQLVLPIVVPSSLSFPTKFSSVQTLPFKGGGSTRLSIDYAGAEITQAYPFQIGLPTGAGIWLLGENRSPQASPVASPVPDDKLDAEIARLREIVASELLPWRRNSDNLYVALAGDLVRGFVGNSLPPHVAANTVFARTDQSSGLIDHLGVMRDDVLGDISLEVTPEGQNFASGTVSIDNPSVVWDSHGLAVMAPLTATAHAQIHVHFNTAFVGGGIGTSVGVDGRAADTMHISASTVLRETPVGRAIVIQPLLECRRIQMTLLRR